MTTPRYLAAGFREAVAPANGYVLVPPGCSARVHRAIYDWCVEEGMGMVLLSSNVETFGGMG